MAPSTGTVTVQSQHHPFYEFIAKNRANGFKDVFEGAREIVAQQPELQAAYTYIFDKYVENNEIQACSKFFNELAQQKQTRLYSLWMLARLEFSQNHPNTCLEIYDKIFHEFADIPAIVLHEYLQMVDVLSPTVNSYRYPELQKHPVFNIVHHFSHYQYKQALAEYSKLRQVKLHSDFFLLHLYARSQASLKNFQKADSVLQFALRQAEEKGAIEYHILFLYDLGKLAYAQGNNEDALEILTKAIASCKEIDNRRLQAEILNLRSHAHKIMGHNQLALQDCIEGEIYAHAVLDFRTLSQILESKGRVLSVMGKNVEALKAYDACSRLPLINRETQIYAEYYKAEIYIGYFQFHLAKKTLQRALKLADEKKYEWEQALLKATLGRVLMFEGNRELARQYALEHIDYLSGSSAVLAKAFWLKHIAMSYADELNYEKAAFYYQQALDIVQKSKNKSYIHPYLFEYANYFYKISNYPQAQCYLDTLMSSSGQKDDSTIKAKAFFLQAQIDDVQGNLPAALKNYRKSVGIFESIRRQTTVSDLRVGFFSEAHKASQHLAGCYLDKFQTTGQFTDLDSALYFIDLGRNRNLKERFNGQNRETAKDATCLAIAAEIRKKQRLWRDACVTYAPSATIDSLYEAVELEHYALMEHRLYLFQSHEDSSSSSGTVGTGMHDIAGLHAKILGQNNARIIYHFVDEKIYAIAANEHNVKIVQLSCEVKQLASQIALLIEPFSTANSDSINSIPFHAEIAHKLYQELIFPIENRMKLPEDVLIVADGVLNQLPFELLLTAPCQKDVYLPTDYPEYTDKFLLQHYSIGYSPATFPDNEKSLISEHNTLVLANPAHPAASKEDISMRSGRIFSPLLHAIIEARNIERIAMNATVLIGREATKENFASLAEKHQVLHLATHAFSDSIFDAFSGAVLAATTNFDDDGILMGYEIEDMHIANYDLVFLSGCDTGRGKFIPGEGTLGLPRTFLGAGARSILMTLWSIDDKFASILSPQFYENYLQKNESKLNALTSAKRVLLKKQALISTDVYHQHPFFWAPFMLYGDPGESSDFFNREFIIISLILSCSFILAAFFLYKNRQKRQ
ncbi:MAG: CHAT domain-containing protein [Deferribacteres bacterium]|nr:CHAT domain-containing protein [Deferribacteres bacterium]